jgi:hypothetical protein
MGEELIYIIVLADIGWIYPFERSLTTQAKCRGCGRELAIGQGMKIRKGNLSRHGGIGAGFLCQVCLAEALIGRPAWEFHPGSGILRERTKLAPELSGIWLGTHLQAGGVNGLELAIREALEKAHIQIVA